MGWFRVDEAYARNPKVMRAGREAALLFIGLLGVYHTHGEGGQIPPRKASHEALLLELGAFQFDLVALEAALVACEQAGLIAREDEAIQLVGMEGAYQSRCSTCKGPVENPRHKTCAECLAKRRTRRRLGKGGKSATPSGPSGNSLPDPEPDPEPTPEPEPALADAVREGAQALKRAGADMPETLRRKAAELFMRSGGGLWDLQRLCAHLKGKPGVLVSMLKDPRQWRNALLDAPELEPQRKPALSERSQFHLDVATAARRTS